MANPQATNINSQIDYVPTQGNDKGYELVSLVNDWWRANKFGITGTERTNVAVAISNLLATFPQ